MSLPAKLNSRPYWEARFKEEWKEKKGGEQTYFFAELLVKNLPGWFMQDVMRHRMSLCDWGCAEGEGVAYLGEILPDHTIVGVDFAAQAIQNAREKYPDHTFLTENWLTRKKLEPKYDVVLSSNVLEHFRQPISVLRRVLGHMAGKYLVLLVPYAEDPGNMEPEHFFRFLKGNFPFAWDDWFCMFFKVIRTRGMEGSRWQGEQALVIYARRSWIEEAGLGLSLDNYPAESAVQDQLLAQTRSQLEETKSKHDVMAKKLENQYLHDKIILEGNNQLQRTCDRLNEAQQKNLARLKEVEVQNARLELALNTLESERETLLRQDQEWQTIRSTYEKINAEQQEKFEQQNQLVEQWRQRAELAVVEQERLAELTRQIEAQLATVKEDAAQQGLNRRELEAQLARAGEEKGQLAARQAELEAQLARAGEEKGQLAARQAELEAQLARAGEEKGQLAARQTELEAQLARAGEEKGQLAAKHAELEAQLARAGEEKGQLAAKHAELEAQLARASEEKGQLAAKHAELEAQLARAGEEKDQLAAQQIELEAQLARAGEEMDQLVDRQAELEAQLAHEAKEKDQFAAAQIALKAEMAEASLQIEHWSALFHAVKDQLGHLCPQGEEEADAQRVRDEQIEQLEQELGVLVQQREAIEAELARIETRQVALAGQRQEIELRARRHQKARGKSSQVAEQARELERVVAEQQVLAERRRELEGDRQGLHERNEAVGHQVERLRRERNGKASQVERLATEKTGVTVDMERVQRLHDQIAQYQVSLKQELAQVSKEKSRLEENLVRLEEDASQSAELVTELQRDKQGMTLAIERLRQRIQVLTSRHEEMEARLEARDQICGTLEIHKRELVEAQEKLQQKTRQAEQVASNQDRLSATIRELQSKLLIQDNELTALRKDAETLRVIKGMYYYRMAQGIDRIKHRLGLSRAQREQMRLEKPAAAAVADSRVVLEPYRGRTTQLKVADPLAAVNPAAERKLYNDFKVGAILDTFTHACFAPESQLILFRPDNWRSILEEYKLDFLMVESAWNGNDGAWKYRVGTYNAPPGRELDDVLKWCWEKGVPTVFWNKEDPPHFDKFAEAAAKFDYVFTTDANCIPKYEARCGHKRIAALPFAAQPMIHNPVLSKPREGTTCFAGTYYADDFKERRQDMDVLLEGGRRHGMDIFDRMHGHEGADKHRYMFPKPFQPHIRGRLDYEQMLQAYRAYKVFLNVNSVYDSPTMFSRRVFELLACGTPVVTTRSLGIKEFFGDLVPQVETVEETQAALELLLDDPEQWWRYSARGIRQVMAEHTYTHRFQTIVHAIGLRAEPPEAEPMVAVVIPAGDPRQLAECLRQQSEPPASVIIAASERDASQHALAIKGLGLSVVVVSTDHLLDVLHQRLPEVQVAVLDSRHYYGPHYLRDARLALLYGGCAVTGLSTHFVAQGRRDARLDEEAGEEYFRRQSLLGATLATRGRTFTDGLLAAAIHGEMAALQQEGYARSRFEFLRACPGLPDAATIGKVCI